MSKLIDKMQLASISFILVLLVNSSSSLGETRHVVAKHCEIFVDKVGFFPNSNLVFRVKTLNERLDGNIVEVGFHHKTEGASQTYRDDFDNHWSSIRLSPFFSNHYFTLDLRSYNSYLRKAIFFEGLFYVKTDKDTVYWAKGVNETHFLFGSELRHKLAILHQRSGYQEMIFSTQKSELGEYNPQNCY